MTTQRLAYITAVGSYLPNVPVSNDHMEEFLGQVGGRPSNLKDKILRSNGIMQRHYTLDREGRTTHLNEELAAAAVLDALEHRGYVPADVTMLATGTTQGDVLLPGFASMVHGRLGGGTMETQTLGGVCCSGMGALVAAVRAVQTGAHQVAVAVASEQVSRSLKADRFDWTSSASVSERFDAEFLRWMLSDGAGAVIVESSPRPDGLSLRVDWTHLASHADRHDPVMFSGMLRAGDSVAGSTWFDQQTPAKADAMGMMAIRQDVRRIPEVLRAGAEEWVRLARTGKLDPEKVDLMLCHFSSKHFQTDVHRLMEETGMAVPEDRWFTNLYEKGNTGSASIYVMLEEAFNGGAIEQDDCVVLLVPESGRVSVALAQLTAVHSSEPTSSAVPTDKVNALPAADDPFAELANNTDETVRSLLGELAGVWADFENRLAYVPIVRRIESGNASLDDYKNLLVNMRQQVTEGARWISRAASNVELFELRSTFIGHAADEHRDFRLLEEDYVSVGGQLEVIQTAEKNIGSEALSAFIFDRASKPDPLDLLGAMFVIEGLGLRKADGWAASLQQQLHLDAEQVRFFRYHGANDDDHFDKLRDMLTSGIIDEGLARRIVKTAKVTARLYALQLEELGNV